jgi:general stress protein YciG
MSKKSASAVATNPHTGGTLDEFLTETGELEEVKAMTDEKIAKLKKPHGFAAMDRARVVEIARKGGKAAHDAGTAHEFTSEEARRAGRLGGKARHTKRSEG